jgi:hypothetical protein
VFRRTRPDNGAAVILVERPEICLPLTDTGLVPERAAASRSRRPGGHFWRTGRLLSRRPFSGCLAPCPVAVGRRHVVYRGHLN